MYKASLKPLLGLAAIVSGTWTLGICGTGTIGCDFNNPEEPDTTAPVVLETEPAADAADVAPNTSVIAVFDEAMDAETLSTASFSVVSAAPRIAGTVSYDSAALSVTFQPDDLLIASTVYTATITQSATDEAGNPLQQDYVWSFTTGTTLDTTPPVISSGNPSAELPAGTTDIIMSVTTDEGATCKWGTSAGTSYAAMANTFTTTGGTSHSTLLSGLTDGQSYNRYIRCQDASGNANSSSYTVSFSVASTACSGYDVGALAEGGGTSWTSSGVQSQANAALTFDFYARATSAGLNGAVTVSDIDMSGGDWGDDVLTVRFAADNMIDVGTWPVNQPATDASGYTCDGGRISCPSYTPGDWYHFVVTADIPTQTYNVQYANCDGALQPLATGASFHNGLTPTSLLYYAVWSENTQIELNQSELSWSPACAPDCSGGRICGDDGCGGTACGTCTGGDVCYPDPPGAVCCTPWDQTTACTNAGDWECGDAPDNCGGTISCGTCSGPTPVCAAGTCEAQAGTVFWADTLQTANCNSTNYNFDEWCVDVPIENSSCGEINDCSDSGTTDGDIQVCTLPNCSAHTVPAGTCSGCLGGAKAVMQKANFNYDCGGGCEGGTRNELGFWSWSINGHSQEVTNHMKVNGNVTYASAEIYMPDLIYTNNDSPWVGFPFDMAHMYWDGGAWQGGWSTFIMAEGRVKESSGNANKITLASGNAPSAGWDGSISTQALPMAEWFCFEMEYVSGTNGTGAIRLYLNGTQILEDTGITTLPNNNLTHVEIYQKFYGDTQGNSGSVFPQPNQYVYRRNMRITDFKTDCK